MDKDRKKQLIEEYKNRKPNMGIISFKNIDTNIEFVGIAKDTKADINSVVIRLKTSWFNNDELQKLWNLHGEEGFNITVVKELKYDNPNDDQTKKLEKLLIDYLEENKGAKRLWKEKKNQF